MNSVDVVIALGIAAFYFFATAPTLRWMEFSSGSENLVVATALELQRPHEPAADAAAGVPGVIESTWALPTLAGQPRVAKPPLATWIAAYFLNDQSLQAIRSTDQAVRDAAYADLTWQIRWPALLSACLTLVATYVLAHASGGRRVAIIAALAHGATYAFLRFGRVATTDVQLALWVTAANAALAMALLRGRHWQGLPLAGLFLGLAFLAKGPVALAQTILPVAAFLMWRRWARRHGVSPLPHSPTSPLPLLAGIVAFIGVAAPWFVFVAMRYDVAELWMREVTRVGATELEPDNPLSYLKLFMLVFPWTIFLIGGGILAAAALSRRTSKPYAQEHRAGLVWSLCLLVVPIAIMTLSKDRKERYLLPMIAPAAVLIAHALAEHLRVWRGRPDTLAKAGVVIHWVLLAGVAIAFPIAGAAGMSGLLRTVEGGAWFAWPTAGAAALGMGLLLAVAIALHPRRPVVLVGATVVVMAVAQVLFAWGYGKAPESFSEMRPLATHARDLYPHAPAFSIRPGRRAPEDLSIYLNRTVRPVESLEAVPSLDKPSLVFIFREEDAPLPPLPEGAMHLGKVQRGSRVWHALAMPAR